MGFSNVIAISEHLTIDSISIHRVPGQHGTGHISELMGTSSGYILRTFNEPTLYITGDTIFYEKIKATLNKYKPDIIIAFGGSAQFAQGDPITLTPEDILNIHYSVPQAKIICVHMDAINHCRTTKDNLKEFLSSTLENSENCNSFLIPDDGEIIEIR
ncbi:hypothetical protein HNQ80_003889 [Anaerosolibacter carboniphilus]|uniref:Uncharacterized protein n=1 Tax=Anaerosolibacter carboniphilus TaxID=1417629 RepID=A0A841KVR3_9FIRM|nr:hypothetical protein [Anaerosolibacter carboniphilus]MBB6217766.1 hypothetical protein [Anaerosolibacter carboniphilus]